MIETNKELNEEQFLRSQEWKSFIVTTKHTVKSVSASYKHVLSHQKIYARFWEIDCKESFNKLLSKTCITIKKEDIHKYAVPRLIENYIEKTA